MHVGATTFDGAFPPTLTGVHQSATHSSGALNALMQPTDQLDAGIVAAGPAFKTRKLTSDVWTKKAFLPLYDEEKQALVAGQCQWTPPW